jgi:ribonucleotide monophosphatase NagD (HAD superfamily)
LINQGLQWLLRGLPFIATNSDATYPLEEGLLVAGAGATVGALTGCSRVEPFVVGKPNPYLIECILTATGEAPENTVVVGDRYETDIVAGLSAGCRVHLVLTGVAREAVPGVPSSTDLRGLLD